MNIINVDLKKNGNLTYGNTPKKIILHHAEASKCTVQDINQWHLGNGWVMIGYHYFIRKDGSIYKGRPDNAIGSHCKGSNTNTVGICFEGDYMKETMPQAQYNAGIELIKYLYNLYGSLPIYGHKDLMATSCPGSKFPLDNLKKLKSIDQEAQWKQDNNGWWFIYSDGSYPKDTWFKVGNDWYYADKDGYCYKNRWLQYNNKWYYFKNDCKMAKNETLTYKFNDNGEWV